MRAGVAFVLAGCLLAVSACGGSPTAPKPFEPAAAIESVATTFRGKIVESSPVVIASPEGLQWEVKFSTRLPDATRVSLTVCVTETATSVGIGTCVALSSTVADLAKIGNVVQAGIRTFQDDGVPRTTTHLYVAFTEGFMPLLPESTLPGVGEVVRGSRVHAVSILPRTITFR
jgi:hypothetical protein